MKLIEQANILYKGDNQLDFKLKGKVFALDSTTVNLCLDVFWWATFRSTKAAVKIHTLLDLKSSIPEFIFISEGDVHDVNILDQIVIQKGSYYVMDKAYIDFERLHRIKKEKAFFVVRAKENLQFERLNARPANKNAGIICDQGIHLTGYLSNQKYPDRLRRIRFYDCDMDRSFVFLTNNFRLKALTVAQLY